MWPPARSPGLDFLDSFRTVGKCGANVGEDRTLLSSGSLVNVSWHLGYPHGGGYKLELACPSLNKTYQLLPTDQDAEWFTEEARNNQYHMVQLPKGVVCDDCNMRLQRQATEWGKKYIFRSCADLRVMSEAKEDCGEGTREEGVCICPRGRLGDRCQYSVDCESDQDCNGDEGQGQCIVTDTTVYRIGHCFCTPGYQGKHCESRTTWEGAEAKSYNREDYQVKELSADIDLLWRRLEGGEVELIMSAPTDSWVGLGWRPAGLKKSCQEFPKSMPKPRGKDFHPMDCTDMVIGFARDGLGRVGDYYTRDRSTPRLDEDWGGESDVLDSHAWEEDGITTMRVVRRETGGVADHPLKGKLLLIWAHGRKSDTFYKPDQLKYHGRGSGRGVTFLDLGEK